MKRNLNNSTQTQCSLDAMSTNMNNPLPIVGIVTRLTRPVFYLNRVLEGLLKQRDVVIEWSIITQIPLTREHQNCIGRAEENGIRVVVTYAKSEIKLGALANMGVQAITTPYVLLHDDDDALINDCIHSMLNYFSSEDIVAVVCHGAIINESGKNPSKLNYVLSPGRKQVDCTSLQQNNLILTNTLLYTRAVFDRIGGYPSDVDVGEDWLFNLDLIANGNINILPKVCAAIYVRKNADIPKEKNTVVAMHDAHLQMAYKIRETYNLPKDIIKKNKLTTKILCRIDRITYKFGGWFFPR